MRLLASSRSLTTPEFEASQTTPNHEHSEPSTPQFVEYAQPFPPIVVYMSRSACDCGAGTLAATHEARNKTAVTRMIVCRWFTLIWRNSYHLLDPHFG